MNPRNAKERYPFVIYTIYAVVITFSFTISGNVLIPIDRIFTSFYAASNALALCLAYFVIITGVIGYSKSIAARPHSDNKFGNLRFVADLVIMFLMYYLINLTDPTPNTLGAIKFNHYDDTFIWVFPVLFSVYLAWDIIKYYEYRDIHQSEPVTNIQRGRKTLYFLILFMVQSLIYSLLVVPYFNSSLKWNDDNAWPVLLIFTSTAMTLGYRYSKWRVPKLRKRRATRKRILSNSST